jgi:hypothetical protein
MSLFQILLLVVLEVVAVTALVCSLKGRLGPRVTSFMAFVCGLGTGAVLWPEMTSKVDEAVGIGRGADLVLYCAVVFMLIGFFMVYLRLRRQRRIITLLVRHLALAEARSGVRE